MGDVLLSLFCVTTTEGREIGVGFWMAENGGSSSALRCGERRGGGAGLQPHPSNRDLEKNKNSVHTIIPDYLRELPISRNQPLKRADD